MGTTEEMRSCSESRYVILIYVLFGFPNAGIIGNSCNSGTNIVVKELQQRFQQHAYENRASPLRPCILASA